MATTRYDLLPREDVISSDLLLGRLLDCVAGRGLALDPTQRRGKPRGSSRFEKLRLPLVTTRCYDDAVKISDDYDAKVRLWARQPRVMALPPVRPLPKFSARKFRTHEEMNQWKQSLLRDVAGTVARRG